MQQIKNIEAVRDALVKLAATTVNQLRIEATARLHGIQTPELELGLAMFRTGELTICRKIPHYSMRKLFGVKGTEGYPIGYRKAAIQALAQDDATVAQVSKMYNVSAHTLNIWATQLTRLKDTAAPAQEVTPDPVPESRSDDMELIQMRNLTEFYKTTIALLKQDPLFANHPVLNALI
ncbi:hypothetical protein [Vibrio sp. SCSIO 43137]|uniref:hypothetical protein n=1 Tax=Vibrio sp. SCSIO 43137 TaxID=3021011 RepID=UPI002307E7A7|nr:hypothetical protein [Vibrio sp. SCSIO 43137]WCE28406.1 hypothetical protein PK654_08435 [Vibrio sp. SCSIO 43137]